MATRENQGLQIALIIFVMLTIILSVTTFLFFRNYQEEQLKSKALDTRATAADASLRVAIEETGEIRGFLGVGPQEPIEKVREIFQNDMKAYAAKYPEPEQRYKPLVANLFRELNTSNSQTIESQGREKDLKDKLALEADQRGKEIAKYQEALATAEADLAQERAKFNAALAAHQAERGGLSQQLAEKNRQFTLQTQAAQAEIKKKEDLIADYRERIGDLKTRVEGQQVASAIPDGKITWVNQADKIVWVDIGTEDGLRRQILFSVVGYNENNPVKAEKKGSVEIIQLVGSHMAEARIVEDDISNPIMVGDQIFSPVWQVGRPERFALAGRLDIDGDGKSDRETVRKLIIANGGLIDAEVNDEGKKSGKMTVNTAYLVLGDDPAEKKQGEATLQVAAPSDEDTPKGNAAAAAYREFKSEAVTLPVKTISLGDFLNHVGYKAEERTIALGAEAKESDFKPRYPDGIQRKSAADLFRARRPVEKRPVTSSY